MTIKQSIIRGILFTAEFISAVVVFRMGLLDAFTVKDPKMVTWVAVLLAYLFVRANNWWIPQDRNKTS